MVSKWALRTPRRPSTSRGRPTAPARKSSCKSAHTRCATRDRCGMQCAGCGMQCAGCEYAGVHRHRSPRARRASAVLARARWRAAGGRVVSHTPPQGAGDAQRAARGTPSLARDLRPIVRTRAGARHAPACGNLARKRPRRLMKNGQVWIVAFFGFCFQFGTLTQYSIMRAMRSNGMEGGSTRERQVRQNIRMKPPPRS